MTEIKKAAATNSDQNENYNMTTTPLSTADVNKEVYQASRIKRKRRSKEELKTLLQSIQGILAAETNQITIRHLFYRLVSKQLIPKTESAYDSLGSHLSKWRRAGHIAWDAFTDSTRWHYGARTFDGMQEALERTVDNYRRNLWADQPHYIEIWTEKDAVASILLDEADRFGVKVFVARGFSSLTSMHSAASTFLRMQRAGKQVHIYHFGDHDPSGVAIDTAVVNSMRVDFGVDLHFQRICITPAQVEEFNLPTRPTKTSDTRAKGWLGGCVEIDAVEPAILKGLVEQCITQHIEAHAWRVMQQTEEMERETMREYLKGLK